MTNSFRGDWSFLSNFYECKIVYEGYIFNNAESAFQAQKCISEVDKFIGINGSTAKRLGKKVTLRPDWNDVRDDIMYKIVRAKFEQNPELRDKLINTYPFEIVERNKWGDTYWGVCNGIGENKLGEILESIRADFRKPIKTCACCFTGHRPSKMFGYDLSNPNYQVVAKKVRQHAEYLFEHGISIFISGGALGFDTVAFFAIESLKKKYPNHEIKNILAIPFANQHDAWKNPVDLDRYERMKSLADEIVYVDELPDYNAIGVNAKLNKRNHYMVDKSMYVIAYWNGEKKGGTYNCLKYAEKQENVKIINIF